MARPKTKIELIEQSVGNFKKLNDYIDALSESDRNVEFSTAGLNRNIRDVLAHLHHWHLLFLGWYEVGMQGQKPDMPAKGYSWKTTPDLNKSIQKKYEETPLAEVHTLVNKSFSELQNIISQHSNEDLFTKKKYGWTGSTSLGAYLISATASHYAWAYKLIKKSR